MLTCVEELEGGESQLRRHVDSLVLVMTSERRQILELVNWTQQTFLGAVVA